MKMELFIDAKKLYGYVVNNSYNAVDEWRNHLCTYTQGTFGEACRQLYHITQESKYMDKAKQVINYALQAIVAYEMVFYVTKACSMDQSIFKSVYIHMQ